MEVGEVQTPESSLGTTNTPSSTSSSPRDEHAEGGQISPTRKQRRTRRSQSLNPQGLLSKQNKTLEFITNQTFRIFAQTIIQGRLVQASSTATEDDVPGGGAGSNEVFSAEGSSDWLNLSVDCLWKVDKDLQRFWQYRDNDTRRVKTVQLTIDIFAREESSSPAGSRRPSQEDTSESQDRRAQNRHRPSDFLLERWCLEYTNEANPDAASPTLNNKHTLVLLRSVAAMICLLPCHKLVRLCKRHPTSYSICYSINDLNSVSRITSLKVSRDRDATSTSISSVLEWSTNEEVSVSTHPQKEKEKEQEKALSGNNNGRSSFKFGEISTKMGSLTVSVEYRNDISRFQKIKSSGIATFIIPDYSPNASSNVTQPTANKTASQTVSTSRAEDPFRPSSFHKIEPSDKASSPPSSAPRKMSNVDLYLDEYFEKKVPGNKNQPSTTPASTIATSAAIPTPRTRRRSAANALASEDDLTTGAEAGDASYPPSLFSLTSPPSVPSLLLTSPPFSQMPDTVGHMATIEENEAISGESSGRARLRSSNPQPIPSASSSSATSSRHHQRKQTKPSAAASCPPCHYGGQNPFSSHYSTSPLSASVASPHNRNEHVQMVPSSMPTTIPHSKSMPPQRQSTASSPSPFSPTSFLLNNYQQQQHKQKQKQNQFPHSSSSPFASSGPLSQTPPIGSGMYGSQCFYMDDPPLVDEEEDDSEWLEELQKVCAIDPPLATTSTLPTSSSFLSPFSSSPPTSSAGSSAAKPIITTSSFPEASLLFSPSLSSPPSPDIDLLLCSQEGAFTTPNREIGEQVGSFVLICSQPPVLKLFKKTTSENDVHSVDLSQFQMVIDSLVDWRDQSNNYKKGNVAKKVQRAPSTTAKQNDRPSSFLRFNYNFNTTAPKTDNQPRHEDLMKHYEEDDPLSNLALDQDSFFDNLSGPQNRTISSNHHFFPSSSSSSRYSKGGGRRSENGGEEEEDEMRRRPSRYWDDYDDSRLSLATDGVMDLSLSDLIQE